MAAVSLMHGPLTGFRILDLSRVLSGPAATMLLADQGADVIKVEPLAGDITRQMGVGNNGLSAGYLNINRGKRAIALNLKSAAGIEIVKKIALSSDVFVQNFRPGAIQNMGLGYDEIKKIKPDIIYVSISGFGEKGPYAHKRVYDPVIQALSGITDIQADAETGRPRMIRTVIPDKTTALTAAQAITAGLLARERSGKGQHIKLAMIDAMIAYLWPEGMINLTFVDDGRAPGVGQLAQDLVFKTLDGYITAGAMSDLEWAGMCAALERPQWLNDPRFNTTAKRFLNAKVRLEETGKVLETKSSEQWLARLDEHGVPCAPILMRPEVISHPQVLANELIHEYDHPLIGRVRQPRPAARFENSDPEVHPFAARLGEHNGEVLAELGYSASEIQTLTDSGVLSA
jgi:crotonobetainyl-CoA:carnitine CoA-transferase CaiB-like acyl-CoA transferase